LIKRIESRFNFGDLSGVTMNPLLLRVAIVVAAVAVLYACIFGLSLLTRLFGQARVGRYWEMRRQVPFAPTHEEKRID
jgi:L-cystine uptake protein TcyP (sodium:dicarboxylate symporter family)